MSYLTPAESLPVLVLGGGPWQVPLIQYLQEHNFLVSIVDQNQSCPGSELGVHFFNADIKDVEAVERAIDGHSFQFAVSDQSDWAVECFNKLNSKWGRPANSESSIQNFLDKTKIRTLAQRLQIPQPKFIISSSMEAPEGLHELGEWVVVKPADSMSSKGVTRCRPQNRLALDQAIGNAQKHSRKNKILIEQCVEGVEVTVEGFCSQGKHRCFALSEKDHFRAGLASSLKFPASLNSKLLEKVIEYNNQYVESSGLSFGITHAEYFVNSRTQEIFLIEIAARGGGTLISSHITPYVSGVSNYDLLIPCLRGCPSDVQGVNKGKEKAALLKFFEFPSGEVLDIQGVAEARQVLGVTHLQLEFSVGDQISNAIDDRGRQGFVLILMNTVDECEAVFQEVQSNITVEVAV